MLQRSTRSGKWFFYPRVCEPVTGDTSLEWQEASGGGTVYSTTIIRRKADKGGDYNLALIDLEEGPRLLSRVEGVAPDKVVIGMRVEARVGEIDGEPAILFTPGEEARP